MKKARKKNTTNETNMNIVNVMTCTMNITGESNLHNAVVGRRGFVDRICTGTLTHTENSLVFRVAAHAKRKRNQTNEIFIIFFFFSSFATKHANTIDFRSLQFTALARNSVLYRFAHTKTRSSRMYTAAATTSLTYYIENVKCVEFKFEI